MQVAAKYKNWTKDNLLLRIAELESHVAASGSSVDTGVADAEQEKVQQRKAKGKSKDKKEKADRQGVDFARAPTRKIALRFSYDGALYSGLAAQNSATDTPLPTVESVLWHALCKGRLVDPDLGMDGAGFSRCGRTDRGVSAAGQVVALWVRSRQVNHWRERRQADALRTVAQNPTASTPPPNNDDNNNSDEGDASTASTSKLEQDEMPYVQILNRILPPTIRVQAWSPVRPTFSARFDCVYRHYKYFFTAGPPSIFTPPPHAEGDGSADHLRLDVGLMRQAAEKLLGEHDFRNLCKIDASKQISNYRRRIDGVSIDQVSQPVWPTDETRDGQTEPMYVLNLRGTAFLYHQVRNIMSILFLVGARLESPTIVEELMNTERGRVAADRVRARLLAFATYASADADSSANTNTDANANVDELERGDLLGGEIVRGLRWWMPVNPTDPLPPAVAERPRLTKAQKEQLGLPMWIPPALASSSTDTAQDHRDAQLEVYDTKPNFEMAADRPLVLWECGFLPTDVQWRVGIFDEPLPDQTASPHTHIGDGAEHDLGLRTASVNLLRLHREWMQLAISTELNRHFVLASASPHTGVLPCRTRYQDACFPHLATTPHPPRQPTLVPTTRTIPLGNGESKGSHAYQPLSTRTREQSFTIRNAKWLAQATLKRSAQQHE